MAKSLRPPVPSFTSAKRRRFTVGRGEHTAERFPGDTLWNDTWPILLGGKQVGSLSRNLNYGTGATGEPRWQGSLSALRWASAMDAPVGIGYDVAAFDTAKECLAAWGRSADELLDWAKSEGKTVPKGGPAPRRGSVRRTARRPAEKAERKAPPVPAEPGYTIGDARYAKGQKLVKTVPSGTGLKSRAERLIGDGLKGRYTNRERGYVVSPAKAARFEEMYTQGWDASPILRELIPPDGHAADVAPARAPRPRRARVEKASPAPAPAPRRRSRIPAAAIEKAREESPGKYPLPLAEQKLAGLYDYVKREGGKLPPCGK